MNVSPSRVPPVRQNTRAVLSQARSALAAEIMVTFEDENGNDTEGAMAAAMKSLERLQWSDDDVNFYFNRAETRMKIAGVKKNYTKFQILSEIIPTKVQNAVKSILRKEETDFPNKDGYKILKKEIIRIFGLRPEKTMERALNRVLVDTPSQLARDLVGDVC